MYPAHIVLDRDRESASRLDKILEWLAVRGIKPCAFRFQMAADMVRVRLEFARLSDAEAVAQAFSGGTCPCTITPTAAL
jgi:hypothetical protein